MTSHITLVRILTLAFLILAFAPAASAQDTAQGTSPVADFSVDQSAGTKTYGTGISGSGFGSPALKATVPVLGTTVVISLAGMTPKTLGVLYMGPIAGQPTVLLGSATFWLDLNQVNTWIALNYATDGLGQWSLGIPLPNDPILAGYEIALQAVTFIAGRIEISNGLGLSLGY